MGRNPDPDQVKSVVYRQNKQALLVSFIDKHDKHSEQSVIESTHSGLTTCLLDMTVTLFDNIFNNVSKNNRNINMFIKSLRTDCFYKLFVFQLETESSILRAHSSSSSSTFALKPLFFVFMLWIRTKNDRFYKLSFM